MSPTLFRLYVLLNLLKSLNLADWRRPSRVLLFLRVIQYTMVPYPRLSNALSLAGRIEEEGVPGAVVECGVWRGGCAAVMASPSQKRQTRRKIWLFDSFEGLPEPTAKDGERARQYSRQSEGRLVPVGKLIAPVEDVELLFFRKLGFRRDDVTIRKGWLQETLPTARGEIGPIALLRIDVDWYESTKACLENLYGLVASHGFVIIDDYGYWQGCKRAVDEFFQRRGETVDLAWIDDAGVYFRKA